MKPSIEAKLQHLLERHEEISRLLGEPSIIADQQKFRALSKEYADLEKLVETFREYQKAEQDNEAAKSLMGESDLELRELAELEQEQTRERLDALSLELEVMLLPKDPNDNRNIFLEIRAGAGGDEAAIFAGDLYRMYARFAESRGWQTEIMSESSGEHGGYKEVIVKISGNDVYSQLKFESGTHRVQRVPATEAQGRIHTSTCTVAILPEAEEIEQISINPADLKVDTYRSSGAGGQHVNKTESAIRITHLPSGIVVECQDERSQHKNRARAMSVLQAKLYAAEHEKQRSEIEETRRGLVGTGDRSERIRTYNYPQGRLTDHRINLTLYQLADIMDGSLQGVVDALRREHQAEMLARLGDA